MEYTKENTITLESNEKYSIIDTVSCDNKKYYYIAGLTEDEKALNGVCKIVTMENEFGLDKIVPVLSIEELKRVLPLLASHYL